MTNTYAKTLGSVACSVDTHPSMQWAAEFGGSYHSHGLHVSVPAAGLRGSTCYISAESTHSICTSSALTHSYVRHTPHASALILQDDCTSLTLA